MVSQQMLALGKQSSKIRAISEYGTKRKQEIGADKVFDFSLGNVTERLICNIEGKYLSNSPQFICRDGTYAVSLCEYLTENPLLFKTADGTVYSGYEVLVGNVNLEKFDQNRISVFDWDSFNTDITKEILL